MTFREQVNAHYESLKGNAGAYARLRAEAEILSEMLLTDPNASARITSATVNGQTFSAQATLSNAERHLMLRAVLNGLDRDMPLPSTVLTTF